MGRQRNWKTDHHIYEESPVKTLCIPDYGTGLLQFQSELEVSGF